jgi:hypothetical protein
MSVRAALICWCIISGKLSELAAIVQHSDSLVGCSVRRARLACLYGTERATAITIGVVVSAVITSTKKKWMQGSGKWCCRDGWAPDWATLKRALQGCGAPVRPQGRGNSCQNYRSLRLCRTGIRQARRSQRTCPSATMPSSTFIARSQGLTAPRLAARKPQRATLLTRKNKRQRRMTRTSESNSAGRRAVSSVAGMSPACQQPLQNGRLQKKEALQIFVRQMSIKCSIRDGRLGGPRLRDIW